MATVYKEVEIDIERGDLDICEIEEVFDIKEVRTYIRQTEDVCDVFPQDEILKV